MPAGKDQEDPATLEEVSALAVRPGILTSVRAELSPMLRLASPFVLAELGWVLMGIVDTIVVGRLPHSAESIAAVSLGTIIFYTAAIFGVGLLLGLDTLISQSFGAGDRADCHRSLVNGLYLSVPVSIVLCLVLWGFEPYLSAIGERPEVVDLARPYLWRLTWSVFPLLFYTALRRYLQAVDVTGPVMFALISANLVNLAGNIVLIYGKLGAPAMGVTGSAWATVISRIYMALVLLAALIVVERNGPRWPVRIDLRRIWRLLALGLPAGIQILAEIGMLALSAVLIGTIDASSLAAHQIALNSASLTFMVTLGISGAAAVRVGQALGRKDLQAAATAGWTALVIGVSFMICAAFLFWSVPEWIARLYTSDPKVIALSVTLLFIAGFFQIFDGTQIILAGALRGAGDTRTAMFTHFAAYWLAGVPLGYLLCFRYGQGAAGIWIGLLLGLALIGTTLAIVWRRKTHRWQVEA